MAINSKKLKIAVVLIWLAVFLSYFIYARQSNLTTLEAAENIRSTLEKNWWGPLVYINIYTLRLFIFFPASILTILGGLVFGVFWGSVWTIIGASLSVAVAYKTGGYFLGNSSDKLLDSPKTPKSLKKMMAKAKSNPFTTTILMRLLYLPFDLVSYLAGIVGLTFWPFMIGSTIGTLVGTVSFVGIGASLDSLDLSKANLDYRTLAISVIVSLLAIVVSKLLQRRQSRQT